MKYSTDLKTYPQNPIALHYTNTRSYLTSGDGQHLFWQKWIPRGQVHHIMVLQHGLGEHSGRYGNLLEALAGKGVAVYALDARGHGRSLGKRGHVRTFDLYADDLDMLVEIARTDIRMKKWPDKVLLLGHSLGGAIAIRYAVLQQQKISGLILSSPGIEVHMNAYNRIAARLAAALVHILPGLVLSSNLNLHNISHDQQVIDDYRADPLTHGKASVKLGHELFRMHHTAYKSAPLIRLPLYIFHGTEDHLTSPRGSCRFFDCVSSPDKEIRLYEGLFHETINEIPIEKARVLRDLTDWIFRH